jgi:hypothetical protein
MLNQNTFFSLSEIGDNFKSKSACHIIYGDRKSATRHFSPNNNRYIVIICFSGDNTEDYIETANLSPEAFEEVRWMSIWLI